MLFHTQVFMLVFLPLVLGGYYLAAAHERPRMWLLIGASLVFYGYWDLRLVPLLVGSVAVNWAFARAFAARGAGRWLVPAGIVLNLAILGVFKYADFFAGSIAALAGARHEPWSIVLPLGISFFTFQQISYLADLGRGRAPLYRFDQYALFVTFFPQLIAGPIVRHGEVIHQFALPPRREGLEERLSRGMALLVIGLAKKLMIADEMGRVVDPLFAAAAGGEVLTMGEAWVAALAFTFQIYFDFSAYSDMAIGLALMFGFTLPLNFDAPLKARSIREFWRRWHMTLTRFVTDYVYVPIGTRLPFGTRRDGWLRETVAAVATMTLLGLWHGAAWTFVVWGGAHGLALALNQGWRRARLPMPPGLGWPLTFLFFAFSMVLFRAVDFAVAIDMLGSAAGVGGWSLAVPDVAGKRLLMVAGAGLLCLLAPTSQRLALDLLMPRRAVALVVALFLVYLVLQMGGGDNQDFIYFQF